jgi:hypothetical protein
MSDTKQHYSAIDYVEDFDKTHYPITESDREIINSLDVCFEWDYIATLHGKIFIARSIRDFPLNNIRHLAESDRLRWISINEFRVSPEDFVTACGIGFLNSIGLEVTEFSIGLTHE